MNKEKSFILLTVLEAEGPNTMVVVLGGSLWQMASH